MEEHRTPFAALDDQADQLRAALIAYLDATAADAEIRRMRAEALALLDPRPGERLLDAGCGAGEVARQLGAAVGPGGEVVGLDLSRDAIAVADSRSGGPPVRYLTGDVAALDFPDGYFDGVRTERVLQHLPEPDRAIAELARVTRPGGRLCAIDTDWSSLCFEGVAPALVEGLRAEAEAAGMRLGTAGRQLRGRLVRAGLVDLRVRAVTLVFTDPAAGAQVLPMLRRGDLPGPPGMSPRVLADFQAAVDAAAAADAFLAALTMWIAVGTVAGPPPEART
ncbi:methyltransferase domain-containing protein [Pilimelia terevasa]|uniref:methyltransferase domain-containing protein n=1 Tax=Pilimelia terevasa TaxID=53372 RepID=UPI0016651D60|nr:methyltransferase domain-containing protein [Pilimelia terevasa]